jgi:peroxiredoxin
MHDNTLNWNPAFTFHVSFAFHAWRFALLLLLLAGCTAPTSASIPRDSRLGQPAPDFALPNLAGETVRLSDLRGQVVLVNFWGTYCPPCKEEMPDLQQLYERHGLAGFTMLAVDVEEPAGVVRTFRDQYSLTFPILLSDDASVNPTFGIRALPTSWLVDQAGVLRSVWVGPVPVPEVEKQIEELLPVISDQSTCPYGAP